MGLDDIDEDDDIPMPSTRPQQQQQQHSGATPTRPGATGGNLLDDLFGGIPTTTVTQTPPPQQQYVAAAPVMQPTQTQPKKTGDFLDDLFSGGGASGGNSSNPTPSSATPIWAAQTGNSPTANLAQQQQYAQQISSNSMNTAGGGGGSSGNGGGGLDLLGQEISRKQHARTAVDFLDGFDAKNKGKAWGKESSGGPKLSEMKGGDTSYTALAANPHMQSLMTYYDFLGVTQMATEEDIRKSYKQKALTLHPDKRRTRGENVTDAEEELFKTITKAHEVLTDPATRAAYDLEIKMQAMTAAGAASARNNWFAHLA